MAIWMVYCRGSLYSTGPVIDVAAGEDGGKPQVFFFFFFFFE